MGKKTRHRCPAPLLSHEKSLRNDFWRKETLQILDILSKRPMYSREPKASYELHNGQNHNEWDKDLTASGLRKSRGKHHQRSPEVNTFGLSGRKARLALVDISLVVDYVPTTIGINQLRWSSAYYFTDWYLIQLLSSASHCGMKVNKSISRYTCTALVLEASREWYSQGTSWRKIFNGLNLLRRPSIYPSTTMCSAFITWNTLQICSRVGFRFYVYVQHQVALDALIAWVRQEWLLDIMGRCIKRRMNIFALNLSNLLTRGFFRMGLQHIENNRSEYTLRNQATGSTNRVKSQIDSSQLMVELMQF